MTMTDPIADFLTRLRNANSAYHDEVSLPHSKIKANIAEILKNEGYISDYRTEDARVGKSLVVQLKYGPSRERSIAGLRRLNALGYGDGDPDRVLNLVYNPQGPSLPPPQGPLEADYRRELMRHFGIRFDRLFALANMPIQRFGSTLVSRGTFGAYMRLLRDAHREENLETVMCRDLLSVDWQGFLHDCDFNQMLGLPARVAASPRPHLRDLLRHDPSGTGIRTADHCYGCTAGQGSSCGGALA